MGSKPSCGAAAKHFFYPVDQPRSQPDADFAHHRGEGLDFLKRLSDCGKAIYLASKATMRDFSTDGQ
jgi:hypothetical protein